MKRIYFLCFLLTAFICSCEDQVYNPYPPLEVDKMVYADPNATAQTKNLLDNMRELSNAGKTMFGHQCSTLYGIGWSGEAGRSDIKSICGDYPAVVGWDLAEIELGKDANIDGDSFAAIRELIKESYARGGITTLSWHTTNPVTNGTAWDNTEAVYRIIPGGDLHEKFCGYLDKVAEFIASLKVGDEYVPVLFRPWHEHSGSGFWWGNGNCTPEQFVALWKFTVEYLRDTKDLHNILYVFSTDIVSSQSAYLNFWPGNEWVDVLGIDAYERSGWTLPENGIRLMRLLNHISGFKNKPFAFTETGVECNTTQSEWWTKNLAASFIGLSPAYVLVWRNQSLNHFYGPYPGCVSEEDFKKFVDSENILLEREIGNIYE